MRAETALLATQHVAGHTWLQHMHIVLLRQWQGCAKVHRACTFPSRFSHCIMQAGVSGAGAHCASHASSHSGWTSLAPCLAAARHLSVCAASATTCVVDSLSSSEHVAPSLPASCQRKLDFGAAARLLSKTCGRFWRRLYGSAANLA